MAKLEPQRLEFADTAPFTADATVICHAPASAVFDLLKDHRRWREWVGAGVTSIEPTSNPGHGLGATRTVRFWRIVRIEEQFVGWDEPALWAFTATSFRPKLFSKLVERNVIDSIDEHTCRITYRVAVDFPTLLRPFGRQVMRLMARSAGRTLERMSRAATRRPDQSFD